ncbi:MAG: SDR family NAD(P)-dependent oxidoreductase [Thermocladium sp.]
MRTAVVTGSGRGIGRSIAVKLAEAGFSLVINVKRHVEEGEETLREVKKHGDGILVQADVATIDGANKLINETIKAFGSVDVLVNNAGLGIARPFIEIDELLWDKLISTNLKSVYLVTRAALPHMIKKGHGKVINITSIAGITGLAYLVPYSAAKAGIIGFTKALAAEVGPLGITVNAVAAGLVKTKMGDSLLQYIGKNEETWVKAHTLTGSMVEPNEVAELVAALASDKIRNLTGEVMVIDSGSSIIESRRFVLDG